MGGCIPSWLALAVLTHRGGVSKQSRSAVALQRQKCYVPLAWLRGNGPPFRVQHSVAKVSRRASERLHPTDVALGMPGAVRSKRAASISDGVTEALRTGLSMRKRGRADDGGSSVTP